jgi:uncharacterized protein YbjT (DUF2867 family)
MFPLMDRPPRRAMIAGATGLVGRACLERLLQHEAYEHVVALSRRPLDVQDRKLQVQIADLTVPERLLPVHARDAFCALGTTLAKAGSKEAFRAVDYRGVLAFADLALQSGVQDFVLVSSVGADPESGNFYLRTKGEAEAAVGTRPFRGVHVLRPGVLLGERTDSRPAEAVMRTLGPWLNPLLQGPLRRYRAIRARDVASAMIAAALEGASGRRVLHYDEMATLSAVDPGRLA